MAQPQALGSDVMSVRRFTDKIDRFRDIPSAIRAPLKRCVAAVYAAHEEDKDDLQLSEPSMDSFKGLLTFLSHPHRAEWVPPAIALNPEGHFVAIWDVAPHRYSVEFLSQDKAYWIGIARGYDQIDELDHGNYSDLSDIFEEPPFHIPERQAA